MEALSGFFILVFIAVLYFIPSIAAWYQKPNNFTSIFLINLVFGWTVLGWITALVMAMWNRG